MSITEEEYRKWDDFINELMVSLITAERKYKYFILLEIDEKSYFDLLFHQIAMRANSLLPASTLYIYPNNIFKFFRFKKKEKDATLCSLRALREINSAYTHLCGWQERVDLIKKIAEAHNISIEDIPVIYKEYYEK